MPQNNERRPEKLMRNVLWEEIFHRGVVDIITEGELRSLMESGKRLRIKYGIDPTMPSAHIGHAVPLKKLRAFQELGHTAVLVIGDYTARIGDPTGKSATRKALSAEEVKQNALEYFDQTSKILDPGKAEVHFQSEWYNGFSIADFISLASKVSWNQLMSHGTFSSRVASGLNLSLHEVTYPLFQAFDSVAVRADIELGGIDQRFNFVLTRAIQKAYGQSPEVAVLSKFLPGTNGQEKMSKSLGNTIDILDSAKDMYAKVMSIPDVVMTDFFELASDFSLPEIESLFLALHRGEIHPMDLKKILAESITRQYHSASEVANARESFLRVVQNRGTPITILEVKVSSSEVDLPTVLLDSGIVTSKSEARRLIKEGAVKINDEKVSPQTLLVSLEDGSVIKIGKLRFLKVKVSI
jgi:tyrosyl-tRNA synthetase